MPTNCLAGDSCTWKGGANLKIGKRLDCWRCAWFQESEKLREGASLGSVRHDSNRTSQGNDVHSEAMSFAAISCPRVPVAVYFEADADTPYVDAVHATSAVRPSIRRYRLRLPRPAFTPIWSFPRSLRWFPALGQHIERQRVAISVLIAFPHCHRR